MGLFNGKNNFLLRFYGLLAFFIGIFFILLHSEFAHRHIVESLPVLSASITGTLLRFLGYEPYVNGAIVSLSGFTYTINYHCSAIFAIIIYASAVLSFPATLQEKITGLLIGVPLLDLINILRLTALSLIGLKAPLLFDFFHEYLWQGIFIIFVIVLWLLWSSYIVNSVASKPT